LGIRNPGAADYNTEPSCLSSTGAMCSYSGTRTGRSPKDKRVVKDDLTKDDIWWGDVNIPISYETNKFCHDLAVKFLNTRPRLLIVDGYAGWDPKYRKKVRIICARPYHAIFMKNMLIRPTKEELAKDFTKDENIDFHLFNAGELLAPKPIESTSGNGTSVQVNFSDHTYTILGS
jgi:phosphoenolpyruvate carboxykinase (ATP)